MTIEEFREIPRLARQIERDREHLLYLKEKATSIPSIMPDPNKVQTSRENRAGVYVDAYIDLEKEIKAKEAALQYMRACANFIIEQEPDSLTRRILKSRYLSGMTWEQVADVVGYTVRRVHQIERGALKKIS